MKVTLPLCIPSPIETIDLQLSNGSVMTVQVKRDDLIDRDISGNKWRKLQPNLLALMEGGYQAMVTTGGAFSNHLSAVARACNLLNLPVTGLVRSGTLDRNNPTLKYCEDQGMRIRRIDRHWSDEDSARLASEEGAYWLPEGGSNELGVTGIRSLAEEILSVCVPDVVFVSVGSGGTLAGLRKNLPESVRICAVSSFDTARMKQMMDEKYQVDLRNVRWIDRFSGSGFGKYNRSLIRYANSFYHRYGIPLDPLYTVKTAMAMEEALNEGSIPGGTRVFLIHTGGLQGWFGYQYRFPDKEFPDFMT